MVNNIKNNTISGIDAKKKLNKLNEIKKAEIIKNKKRTPGHKRLLNLYNYLSDIILTDKILENQENKNYENEYEDEDYENKDEDDDYEYEDDDETIDQNEMIKKIMI